MTGCPHGSRGCRSGGAGLTSRRAACGSGSSRRAGGAGSLHVRVVCRHLGGVSRRSAGAAACSSAVVRYLRHATYLKAVAGGCRRSARRRAGLVAGGRARGSCAGLTGDLDLLSHVRTQRVGVAVKAVNNSGLFVGQRVSAARSGTAETAANRSLGAAGRWCALVCIRTGLATGCVLAGRRTGLRCAAGAHVLGDDPCRRQQQHG